MRIGRTRARPRDPKVEANRKRDADGKIERKIPCCVSQQNFGLVLHSFSFAPAPNCSYLPCSVGDRSEVRASWTFVFAVFDFLNFFARFSIRIFGWFAFCVCVLGRQVMQLQCSLHSYAHIFHVSRTRFSGFHSFLHNNIRVCESHIQSRNGPLPSLWPRFHLRWQRCCELWLKLADEMRSQPSQSHLTLRRHSWLKYNFCARCCLSRCIPLLVAHLICRLFAHFIRNGSTTTHTHTVATKATRFTTWTCTDFYGYFFVISIFALMDSTFNNVRHERYRA